MAKIEELYGNEEKMKEIENLGKSEKEKDKLDALRKFEEYFSILPYIRAREFLDNMLESENIVVKKEAERVYDKTIKEFDRKIAEISKTALRGIAKTTESALRGIAKNIAFDMRIAEITSSNMKIAEIAENALKGSRAAEMARISSIVFAKNIANILVESSNILKVNELLKSNIDQIANALTIPIIDIKGPQFEVFENIQKSVKEIRDRQYLTIYDKYQSPMMYAASIIQPILQNKRSSKTVSEIIGKKPEVLKKELQYLKKYEKDAIFNYPAYGNLFILERFLRDLIKERIIEKYPKMFKNKIPSDVLKRCEEKQEEEKNDPLSEGEYHWVEYSDFTDLKRILEKGRNHEVFSDLVNQQYFNGIIAKLYELEPIRKKIAHSRVITKNEFERLGTYAGDILKMLSS